MRILVSAFNHPSMDLLLNAIANKLDEWWFAAGLVEDDKPCMKLVALLGCARPEPS